MRKLVFFIILIFLKISGHVTWTNLATNQFCKPIQIYYPKNIRQLCDYIKTSASSGYHIRVVGAGYSYSDIVCTDGILLNLKYLNHILYVDTKNKLVKVQAGITIRELNEQLALHNLALPNQAAVDTITIGGAICTGVHGTGHTGTFASFVTELDLITADGVVHNISPQSDVTLFNCALVGFGALGVIYSFTIQCEELFYLEAFREKMDIKYLLENYKQLNNSNDFFQFLWNVPTNSGTVYRWNRCNNIINANHSLAKRHKCFETLTWHTIDPEDKDIVSEIAIPIDLLPEALEQVKQLIEKYRQGRVPQLGVGRNAPIIYENVTIRFVKADKYGYLSPAFNRDVAYINVSVSPDSNCLEFLRDFQELLYQFDGRPHWGKMNFMNYASTLNAYGNNLIKFIEAKNQLDPLGIFSNEFVKRICEFK